MEEKIKVLIVDDVDTTRENIRKLMEFHPEIEVVGQAGSGEEAMVLAKGLRPDVILMDINMPGMDGIAATENIGVEVPETSIIIMSVQGEQEYLRRAMMAGAKNYLTKPFTGDELINAVKDAFSRELRMREALRIKSGAKAPAQVITVFSGKGGVGKTSIAVNLSVALAARPSTKVALVDADIQFGDASLTLNVLPRSTIADIVAEKGQLEGKVLPGYMTAYSDSLHLLAAPFRPEQADKVTGTVVTAILKQLKELYDYVIVDTATSFSEVSIASLDAADKVLLVTVLDLPAVKNTKAALETMESLGYHQEKIVLLLNRATPEGGIDAREVEESLKRKFALAIPTDGKTVVGSVNKGFPFILANPAALVSQKIIALASLLAPETEDASEITNKSTRRFKFFGR